MSINPLLKKASWLKHCEDGSIRPYVYVREDNRINNPGSFHSLDWFPWQPVCKDPLKLEELPFAESIYHLENTAFGPQGMPIPRWVFYDCGVLPGFVAGFAMQTQALPAALKKVLKVDPNFDWTPLSLFIIIPTMKRGEWVAHNLCAVNSLVPEADRLYGLGFLSKAFGLWYANVETCCGMTQWGSPALKLHSHYGHLEVLTSYTPVHSHDITMTYRSRISIDSWEKFFSKEPDKEFFEKYEPTRLLIDPTSKQSMIDLHRRLTNKEGPFFLSAAEISQKKLDEPLVVYQAKKA